MPIRKKTESIGIRSNKEATTLVVESMEEKRIEVEIFLQIKLLN